MPRLTPAILAFLFASPALAQAPAPEGRPSATDPRGFPPPSLKGFEKVAEQKSDASPDIEGEETTVEVFENPAGDRLMKLSLNGIVWAFGYLPGGDPMKGYVLRDPDCKKKLTEKWAPDAPFSAPECAVKAKPPK